MKPKIKHTHLGKPRFTATGKDKDGNDVKINIAMSQKGKHALLKMGKVK